MLLFNVNRNYMNFMRENRNQKHTQTAYNTQKKEFI